MLRFYTKKAMFHMKEFTFKSSSTYNRFHIKKQYDMCYNYIKKAMLHMIEFTLKSNVTYA
jgi:hypothetical protein